MLLRPTQAGEVHMAKDKKKHKPKKKCCEKPARKMCKRCPRRFGCALS